MSALENAKQAAADWFDIGTDEEGKEARGLALDKEGHVNVGQRLAEAVNALTLRPVDTFTDRDLKKGIVVLCQTYGYVSDATYDLIDSVIDSIKPDPEE